MDGALSGTQLFLVEGVHDVSSGEIIITKDINITAAYGALAVLDGGNTNSVLRIISGTVVLTRLKLTRGVHVSCPIVAMS